MVALTPKPAPKTTRARQEAGFTMLEVMMAMLLAMVGLLGTVAVQQTLLNATRNANDGAIALRLCSQAMEEFNSRAVVPGDPPIDRLKIIADGLWTQPVFLNALGQQADEADGTFRWARRTRVSDGGLNQPYAISIEVQYALDTGAPKTVRLDLEKWK